MLSLNRVVYVSILLPTMIHICILSMALTHDPLSHTLVTRLTHFHSIYSPYFDPDRSTKELADIDVQSSLSRALYLTANKSTLLQLTDIESQLTPRQQNGFLARLGVGSREVEQLVYMDTGSNLLWINCEPCGYNVPGPIFHPRESLSYEVEDCLHSDICASPGAVRLDSCDDTCPYGVAYGGGGYSRGHLARETFKFGRSIEALENIIFGCARNTNLNVNGVLGLVIGDKIELLGSQTPLTIEDRYYITLEGITIGDKQLDFNPRVFQRIGSDYTGGMLVDTGSTLSFMPQVVLKKLEAEVINVIGFVLDRNYSMVYEGYTRLCYNGALHRDLTSFPTVQLEFKGEATMELTAGNIFQQIYEDRFCLAILPSEILGTTVSILGNLMQQYFYVAYDLRGMKLAFQRMECNLVDDYIRDEL